MRAVGFELVKERNKVGGKVAYWLWAWRTRPTSIEDRWGKKRLEMDGPKRNNFAVLLSSDH